MHLKSTIDVRSLGPQTMSDKTFSDLISSVRMYALAISKRARVHALYLFLRVPFSIQELSTLPALINSY